MDYYEEYLKVSQERDQLKYRVAELETAVDGKGLTHTIDLGDGIVLFGNEDAAKQLEADMESRLAALLEVKAWRERFSNMEYRRQDDLVTLKFGN